MKKIFYTLAVVSVFTSSVFGVQNRLERDLAEHCKAELFEKEFM